MTDRDPLSLQSLLFTAARALGGTWQPAPSVIGDVAIKATERTQLGDGAEVSLTIIITASQYDTHRPLLHLTHFLSVRPTASSVPPHVNVSTVVPCAFDSIDSIMQAFDTATEQINESVSTLAAAAQVTHVG